MSENDKNPGQPLQCRAAVIQMVSGQYVDENLKDAESLVRSAAGDGAELVVLPENFLVFDSLAAIDLATEEASNGRPIQQKLAALAAELGIFLIAGSLPTKAPAQSETKPEESHRANSTSLVFDSHGEVLASYNKMHLFDVDIAGDSSRYRESEYYRPGDGPVQAQLPWGAVGLSICYDLRFPELYRHYAAGGCVILTVPSAFTAKTGEAHWDILLRARAIENQCFVLAPDQGGEHANGRATFGHSQIIDPWGRVLASIDKGAGVAIADLDLTLIDSVRKAIPAQQHRRL